MAFAYLVYGAHEMLQARLPIRDPFGQRKDGFDFDAALRKRLVNHFFALDRELLVLLPVFFHLQASDELLLIG